MIARGKYVKFMRIPGVQHVPSSIRLIIDNIFKDNDVPKSRTDTSTDQSNILMQYTDVGVLCPGVIEDQLSSSFSNMLILFILFPTSHLRKVN